MKKLLVIVVLLYGCGPVFSAEKPVDGYSPGTGSVRMDGVPVEAHETYLNPKRNEFSLGAGVYPLDPYYYGFSLNASYAYFLNSSFAWEVLNGIYTFNVTKDLTSQLAERFGVNPEVIEKLEYILATHLVLYPTYGKNLLFKKFIQSSRTGLFAGPCFVKSTLTSRAGVSFGALFETQVSDTFSWRLDFRDTLVVEASKHFVSVNFVTGMYF